MRPRSTSIILDTQARYVMLGSLAEDRRVLDVGCSDARALQALAEGGPSELSAVCSDAAAVARELEQAGIEGVEVLAASDGPLPFADASFDLVICDDLAERLATQPQLVAELRRVLDPGGTLTLAIPDPSGATLGALTGERVSSAVGYEALYARLAPSFGALSVLGQAPMVGSMFLDLSSQDDDAAIGLDPSLLDGEQQAGWLLLFFGPEPVRPAALPIVPVPIAALAGAVQPAAGELASGTVRAELAVAQEALERVVVERNAAHGERDAILAERSAAFEQLGAIAAERDGALAEVAQLVAERDGLAAQMTSLAVQRDELSLHLAGVASERDTALDQRGQLLAERDALAAEHAQLSSERTAMSADHEGLLAQRDALAAERDALAGRAAALEVERHEAQEANEGLIHRLQELDGELASQHSRAAQAVARAEALEARIAEQAQAHDESLGRLSELESASALANQRLDQLRALEQQAEAHEEELRALRQRQADEVATRSVELERALVEERAARTALEAELAHARTEGGALEHQIRALLEETTALRRTLEEGAAPVVADAAMPPVVVEAAEPPVVVEAAMPPVAAEPEAPAAPAEPEAVMPPAEQPAAELAPPAAPVAVVSEPEAGLDFALHPLPGAASFDAHAAAGTPEPVPEPAAPPAGEAPPPVAIADVSSSKPADSPADTLFGELQVGAAAPSRPRPVTLDDLEELLASSVPPTPRR
jgi:SAM-dependent methyltransferase